MTYLRSQNISEVCWDCFGILFCFYILALTYTQEKQLLKEEAYFGLYFPRFQAMVTSIIVFKPVVRQDVLTKGVVVENQRETNKKEKGLTRTHWNVSPVWPIAYCAATPMKVSRVFQRSATSWDPSLLHMRPWWKLCMWNIVTWKLPFIVNISLRTTPLSFAICACYTGLGSQRV